MMRWFYKLPLRFRSLVRKSRLERELSDELRFHLEKLIEEKVAIGMKPEQARYWALRELGGVDQIKEECRDVRRVNYIENFVQDVRFGLRMLAKNPGFTVVAVLTLAMGIGANTSVFSVFNSLYLRPLPFAEPQSLVDVDETAPKWNLQYAGVSNPDLHEWRNDNSTFEGMAFFRGQSYNLSYEGATQRVATAQVTREMLDVLRLKLQFGRNFSAAEDKPGGAKVALLTHGLWQGIFRSDPKVLGQVVKLDEEPYTVIGVLPRETAFPDRAELWVPLSPDPSVNSGYYANGIGRLRAGVTIEQAHADLLRIHKAMISQGHSVNEITSPILTPFRDRYLGDFKVASLALVCGMGLVLLIVCLNVAALMLVRVSARSGEISIRTALGASRGRIVAQLLTESIALASAGGVVGGLIGEVCVRAIVPVISDKVPQWVVFSLDWYFVFYGIGITGGACLFFGLVPAFQTSRADISGGLHNLTMRITPSRGQRSSLSALVVAEVSLALMLCISAGLLVQAFRKVLSVDPGFQAENVLTFNVTLPKATYSESNAKVTYYDNLLAQLRVLPGVKAVGATSAPPLGGQWGGVFEAEGGRSIRAEGENPTVLQVAVTPGYFRAIGMTLVDGRTFDQQDFEPQPRLVAMVNETFVKHFWGGGKPARKRIRRLGGKDWYQVIGVLQDEKHYGLDQEAKPGVFLPYPTAMLTALTGDERAFQQTTIVLRSSMGPQSLATPAREIAERLDSAVPVYAVRTMREQLDKSLWARRASSSLFAAAALIALLLAALGIYGTASYRVSWRTHEFGLRIALGAGRREVLSLVLGEGFKLALTGVAFGTAGALGLTRFLSSLLFAIKPTDSLTFVGVIVLLVAVTLVASYIPARRATKVDPMVALRCE